MARSLGLKNIGACHWPPMRATTGRSLLTTSAKVAVTSIARKIHSETCPMRLRRKRAQARWFGDSGLDVGAGRILAGTAKGEVIAVDLAGKGLWTTGVAGEIIAPPTVAGKTVRYAIDVTALM